MKLDFWRPKQEGYSVPDAGDTDDQGLDGKRAEEEEETLLPRSAASIASAIRTDPPRKAPLWVWPLLVASVSGAILRS